jgi:peptidoglycan/xylan/chitin deacetylase (PgdA/CDA1 family)
VTNDKPSVCLTFDFDAMSLWIGTFASNNPSAISRGEFGVVGVQRLLALFRKHDILGSFCIPGHTAYAFPDLLKEIQAGGHEIVHHGWVHENPASFDRDGEKGVLERGLEAIDFAVGERPRGYRSPAWDLSPNSIELLLELGFFYDSSCMGSDFNAYYLRKGDRWSQDGPYVFGELTDMVEIPVSWGLDDFPPFEFVIGANEGLKAPSAVLEIWQGDFDYMIENVPGGVFDLTMHPQVIGRGHRIKMLERLIEYMKGAGVRFERLGDYAERWKGANPVEEWREQNPYRVGLNAYTGEPAKV